MSVPGDAKAPQVRGTAHEAGFEALASAHVVVSGFADLSGVAAEPSGALLVTDRVAGTLSRISPHGDAKVLLRDLHAPVGVATNDLGDVFILEARAGRVLQVRPDGGSVVAAGDLRQPSALAIGPDGRIWIAVHGHGGDEVARLESSGGLVTAVAGLPAIRALAVTESALLVATQTSVEKIGLRPDGSAGSVTPIVQRWHATGIAADRFGDAYISGWPVGAGGAARAGILKYEAVSGRTTRFATGLRRPGALALEPKGNLVVAEGPPHGRLWRFLAPAAPVASLPGFTRQSAVVVTGTAERGSRVQAFGDDDILTSAIADELAGRFTMTFAIAPNSATTVVVVATAAGGLGLAGSPAAYSIVHDDVPPRIVLTSPPAAAYVRDAAAVGANATDEGSRMAFLRFLLDDMDVGGAAAAGGESSLTAHAVVDVGGIAEGMRTLTAVAADRAGNQASAAQLVVVDRTPPETVLVAHPAAAITEDSATFTFSATDIQSPALEFSWRLDAAEWSPYGANTSAVLDRLQAGPHTFEVRARDLAGNEDATPASWEFQVRSVHVSVAEPVAGSTVAASTVWVRGEAGGTPPVTVSIPLAPELQLLTSAITAPVINGRFAVEMPVVPGTWSLAVTASDGAGASATQAVEVLVQDVGAPAPGVPTVPATGFVPHNVQFGMASLPAGMYTVDLESDGTIEYSGERPDGRQFTYSTAGAFLATITATDVDGIARQWRSAVFVYDRAALEAELRTTWTGLKDALRGSDADAAAAFVHTGRRDVWRGYFVELAAAVSGDVDAIFTEIELVGFEGDRLECEMMRAVDGLMFSFPVSFAMDVDGRWRLWQF